MPIITLTTDFGSKDPSVGAVKGAIYSQLKDVILVDITHEVSPFNIYETAYIVKNVFSNFPVGSIHIIGVDSGFTPETKHIAVQLNGHYFICADNGILSLIASKVNPEAIYEINLPNIQQINFPVLDVFVNAACHLARGGVLGIIGTQINKYKELRKTEPVIQQQGKVIIGHVVYIDNYGNVVTNITKDLFMAAQKNRTFIIKAKRITFDRVVNSYSNAINFTVERNKREEDGKKIALFNSSGNLELAIYKSNPKTVGSASTLFGLKYMDTISVTFED